MKLRHWGIVSLAILGVGVVTTVGRCEPVDAVVPDALSPIGPAQVRVEGYLGQRLRDSVENRVVSQDLEAVIRPFREKKEIGDGDWRCEYWGKWYTSLVLACAAYPTPEHMAVLKRGADALLATAASDGYLGTRIPEHRLKGWDIWGRKYVLLGLIGYYDLTGDPAILQAACRHLDTLLAEIGPNKANMADLGYPAWKGLPASSVLEPVVLLYRRTGEKKYLDFAEYIVGQWSKPSKYKPHGMRLIEDALAGKSPADICAPKAYEQMSCYEGLCELYRATGNAKYRDAALKLAEGILRDETTLIGGASAEETWGRVKKRQTQVLNIPQETCVTVTWMKFAYQLLRLTGDVRYADELERSLDNALLGALLPDGHWWAYCSGLMGERVPSHFQHNEVGLSCCVASGPRGLHLTQFWAVMANREGPVVNLYFSGSFQAKSPKGQTVDVVQETEYPREGQVKLSVGVAQSEDFTIAFRIPQWSETTKLTVNGQSVDVKPGSYARLRREWKAGDKVEIAFDMRAKLVEVPDGNGQLAVVRGPIVLALDNRLVPAQPGHTATFDCSAFPMELKARPEIAKQYGLWMAFDVPFVVDGKKQSFVMCDYASAGSRWTEANIYRTWLPQPVDLGKVYQTGVTWSVIYPGPSRPSVPPSPKK
jgi:DUF1680 family protein